MLRSLFVPLFGYKGLIGLVITLIFRLVRGLGGVVFILLVNVAMLLGLGGWLALPVLAIHFWGGPSLAFFLLAWLGIAIARWESPRKIIAGSLAGGEDPLDYAAAEVKRFLGRKPASADDLLEAILDSSSVAALLERLGFESRDSFLQEGASKLAVLVGIPSSSFLRPAYALAWEWGDKHLETTHILAALLREAKYQFDELTQVLGWLRERRGWLYPPALWSEDYDLRPLGGFNRAWTGRVTPTLDKYSWDLTVAAQQGQLPPLIGKKKPLQEALRVLAKTSRQNVIFVGSPGCGKTSLVYGLAREIMAGTQHTPLQDKRLVSLDLGALSSGTTTSGELSERLVTIVTELEASGNIILFIDEIHNAVAAGGGVATSVVFSVLEPHLASGKFQVIGATSWNNYRKYVEPNEAFARLFAVVEIPDASPQETLAILKRVSVDLEKERGIVVSYPALKACVELSNSFVQDRVLPDKAVGVLEEVMAAVGSDLGRKVVLAPDVEQVVSEKAKVPVGKVGGKETKLLLELEETMRKRFVGQEEAVKAAADAIRRARVGLREKDRPIASLLFIGPTGVGKTEMAKTLAEVFFGDEKRMIRADMAEYQRQEGLVRLIGGSAPGLLTDAVRKNPHSLVLLDELEKAHPQILDVFLQVLDDGRLTDASGRTVDFSHTIIIATSNAGTSLIYDGLRKGESMAAMRKGIIQELESVFRIEFLNRFDGTVIFRPLTPPQVEKIARLKLEAISRSMAEEKDIKLIFTEGLIKKVAQEGFDPALGARPLRRVIQDKLEAPLARKILMGEIKKGMKVEVGEDILSSSI